MFVNREVIMDTSITFENPTRAGWIKRTKRILTIWPVLKDEDKWRYATDKNWGIVFVVIFSCWLYVIYQHTYSNVLPDYGTITNNTSPLVFDETDYNTIASSDNSKDNIEIFHHESDNKTASGTSTEEIQWDEVVEIFFIFAKAYTCNPSNLDKYGEKLKYAVGIHLLACLHLLLIAIAFIHSDKKMFTKQPSVFGAALLIVALIERLSVVYNMSNPIKTSWLPSDGKLIYWVLPETLIFIIWLSKMFSVVHFKGKDDFCDMKSMLQNGDNDGNDSAIGSDDESIDEIVDTISDDEVVDINTSTDSDNGSDAESVVDEAPNDRSVEQATENNGSNNSFDSTKNEFTKIRYVYKIIPFHYYTFAFVFSIPFVIILKSLMTFTISLLHNADWHQSHSYVIAGGSIYVGLTIYHFALMLTACATDTLIDSEHFTLNDLFRALHVVSRYHFGSACYRAIPVGGPLAKACLMKESELKTFDWYSPERQAFYKHNMKLSRTLIGARGYNHADAVREVIRIVSTVSMQDYFYSFGSTTRFFFTFLLPINSLTIIFLRDRGVYDPHFAEASWVMYLTMTFIFYLVMPFFKTVSDTISLRMCDREVNRRQRFGEV